MSLYFLNNEGRWEDARHRGRQPREEHWGHYRKAMKNRPDLVEAMDKKIAEIVPNFGPEDQINSTVIGAFVLERWHLRDEWNRHCAHESVSSSLFGQIMWTYFYDRSLAHPEEEWWTTYTEDGRRGREERAYFRHCPHSVQEATPQPKVNIDLERGDRVKIKDGPFENFEGTVEEVIEGRGLVKVMLIIFNRPTPVDLEYWQLERI